MLVDEGKVSLFCFLVGVSSSYPIVLSLASFWGAFSLVEAVRWHFLALYSALLALVVRLFLRGRSFKVGIRALFLGCIFSVGLHMAHVAASYSVFGWYMCVMSFFHFSEFITIAVSNPDMLSVDSYILNHSPQYKIAAVSSWIEFWIEYALWPDFKLNCWPISVVGLVICMCGEAVRKLAMVTAQTNFNHVVQSEKRPDHMLVTHGVYALCRHPAYAGWFYWAVGTQMILVNPVCIVGYLAATWMFFNDRITIEEVTLLNFFQYDYVRYQDRVPTGLPFIRGYPIKEL